MTLTCGKHALKLLRYLVQYVREEFTHKDSQALFHLNEALKIFEESYGENGKGTLNRFI